MKNLRKIYIVVFIAAAFILNSCDEFDHHRDNTPPSPPKNIRTVTGDNRVDIYWDENRERDVAGYNVYFSFSYDGKYKLIGSTESTYYIDYGAKNGETYYYAVTAYDFDGNESELSDDVVYDTPRPEGFNQAVFDYKRSPNNSGYDFSRYLVVPYNDKAADFFFEKFNGVNYINVWEDSDVQDMGATKDIWDVSFAPQSGWVQLKQGENIKYVEAIPGRTYVIWTWDNHYAKIRVKSISGDRLVFDWAYQLVEGNRQLKRYVPEERKTLPAKAKRNL
ncbi:MAG: hypothetical protein FD143_2289 [Ignavibacteria bacterium]|nr:MAG: hypothetical protein FD143_2289 [Ignavibacteria bacterium]KAF0159575.1 MAG: hypothetical protein FD188_2176 [Ignavibacteria bacterium]